MRVFSIDRDGRISAVDKTQIKAASEGSVQFRSEKELQELAQQWPAARLVNVWNGIAGVPPVRKFTSRQIATARIWKAIQNLAPGTNKPQSPREEIAAAAKTRRVPKKVPQRVQGSRKTELIALLSTGEGASLPQLMAATGWQKHSVRGFLSGTLKKKMGLTILSSKNAAGERVYRISE